MVDFHGLHVEEALGYAKQEFDSTSAALGDDRVVRFIVGTPPSLQAAFPGVMLP